jgi:small basic protein (TIGR04137 family)
MSIDKSLKRKNTLQRARSVLTRGERIKVLNDEERWKDGQSPFGLPKVRVVKIVLMKARKVLPLRLLRLPVLLLRPRRKRRRSSSW